MHSLPPWYLALNEFSYVFHSLVDVLFIVLGFAVIVVVSRPRWKQHLCWANPGAAASVLTGISRLVLDLHHYFGIGTRLNAYLASDLCNYGANILSLYSAFIFWRMIRDLARHPVSLDPLAEQTPSPGVWPPPPVVKR